MRKAVIIAASLMLAAAPAANAQALLNRLKEKATNAINNAVTGKITEKATDKISEKTGIDLNSMEEGTSAEFPMADSREALQPKRSSSFGWDGIVTPSKADSPVSLMKEFPAVPSAARLADPAEEDQIAYYKAIKAVTLRAEELNADTTCEDSFTEKWRAETEQAIMDAYGITAAEMKAMNEGTLTPAQQEAIEDRMRAKMFGGVDLTQLGGQAQQSGGMNESDVMNMTLAASEAVFRKHDAELRKYYGVGADEYVNAARENMKSNSEAASKALEKKGEAHLKTLDAATQKEARTFQSNLQKELMQANMNAIPGAGLGHQISQNMASIEQKLSPLVEKQQKLQKYTEAIAAAWPKDTWSDADAKFSDAERRKIEAIKSQINATSEPDTYNPLYLQAMELIRTYRERAAKVWSADVQNRYAKIQNGMDEVIRIQRQAVAEGVIPECALWRTPLNLVIEAGDVLAEAYSNFPSNYPHMYFDETARQVSLRSDEYPWWPEFYVTVDLDEVLAGNNIFKEDSNGRIYQYSNGSWNPVPKDYGKSFAKKEKKPASASWKSGDGKRTVVYNAEGGFLQFPEGDIVYPVAWEKRGNEIVWAENDTVENQDGTKVCKVIKCTYKL